MISTLAGRTILVIDDEPSICEMICDFVDLFGGAAIGLTSVNPDAVILRGVDVVMIDLMLTGNRNGVEVAQAFRVRGYTGPLVALSASDGMLQLSHDAGDLFAATIAKPFDTTPLYNTLMALAGMSAEASHPPERESP